MKRITALVLAVILVVTLTTTASASISDVKPGNWAYDAVQYNIDNKLIAVDYNIYDMNAPAPRQDVAYALYKLTNGKDVEPSPCTTVPEDMKSSPDKYKYSVQWAVDNDIIAGTKVENNKIWFSPTSIVTREQMATLLYRLAKHDGLSMGFNPFIMAFFTDVMDISSWAQNAMCWCVSNGLMQGTGNGRLSPRNTLTYGQLAQFILNYANFKSQTPEPTPEPTPTIDPDYRPGYYNLKPLPTHTSTTVTGKTFPARQDHSWLVDKNKDMGYWDKIDITGPWDTCKALPKTWLPEGGYIENGHRYNKYHVCIDAVDGLPTDDEKKAFICINQHRVNQGLAPIEWDQAAQVIAEIRSLESITWVQGGQPHTRPDGDSHIDPIMDECHSIGILAIKTNDGWLNENGHSGSIHAGNGNYHRHMAIPGFIESAGHNETLLATNTTHGAISDLSGVTCYNGLQMS